MPSIYGSSMSFPGRITPGGSFEIVDDYESIWSCIEHILCTARGTAPMDPGFGIEIGLFDSVDSAPQFAFAVGEAIERSEPRVQDIEITINETDDPDSLSLDISITAVGSSSKSNRVFPFYRGTV